RHKPPRMARLGQKGIPSLVVPRELPPLSFSESAKVYYEKRPESASAVVSRLSEQLVDEHLFIQMERSLKNFQVKGDIKIDPVNGAVRDAYFEILIKER